MRILLSASITEPSRVKFARNGFLSVATGGAPLPGAASGTAADMAWAQNIIDATNEGFQPKKLSNTAHLMYFNLIFRAHLWLQLLVLEDSFSWINIQGKVPT